MKVGNYVKVENLAVEEARGTSAGARPGQGVCGLKPD